MPVIILTARAEISHKVEGLNAGANDYVTKPFSFDELLARIQAALRSSEQPTSSELVVVDIWDYSFDPGSNVVDVYVGYLRRKLNRPGLDPFLFTVRGAGYRFLAQR